MIRASLICVDCGAEHEIQVGLDEGRLPLALLIDGWWYYITAEDRGVPDGLSIPVYAPGRALQRWPTLTRAG